MNRLSRCLAVLTAAASAMGNAPQSAPVVHAILFFSPTCPHCHEVIQESLPPIVDRYGESLLILAINTQSARGQHLFREAGRLYAIPPDELGVPLLAVGERALIGSFDIPDQLPGIVDAGLASGGIAWPDIPGLGDVLLAAGLEPRSGPEPAATVDTAIQPEVEPLAGAAASPDVPGEEARLADVEMESPASPPVEEPGVVVGLDELDSRSAAMTPWDRFSQDREGNTIALLALIGMLASLVAVSALAVRGRRLPPWPGWAVGLIIAAGLCVAAYLSYVEVTQSEAVCGPVGDCNTVQQSPYARLFGLIPVGVLGLYGYAALGLGWLLRDRGPRRWNEVVAIGLWLGALFGTLFSIYLTLLEPFVIGATCMWCVTSAVLMTLLLWAASPGAVDAWRRRRYGTGGPATAER